MADCSSLEAKFMTVVAEFCIVLYKTNQQKCNKMLWTMFVLVLSWVELYQSHLCLCSHRITSLISHADTANIDTSNKAQSLRKGTLGATDPVDIIVAFGVTCAWVTWCITSLSKHADFHFNFPGPNASLQSLMQTHCKS